MKKYAKAAGLVGVPLLFVIFIYLSSMGDILITGNSDDMICAGTTDDPCYAYINFTAQKDIYIYPMAKEDTTWMLGTDLPMQSITMQRSWGTGWRTIDLNKTYSKDVKYAVKFSSGQNYSLRFIGYKNDAFENIKWSFGNIDPKWIGVGNYEIPDKEFIGKKYTPQCLGKCDLVINFSLTNIDLNLYKKNFTLPIKYNFGSDVKSWNVYYADNVTYLVDNFTIKCVKYNETITDNTTHINTTVERTNCSIVGNKPYPAWRWEWKEFSNTQAYRYNKTKSLVILITVEKTPKVGDTAIDVVPNVSGYGMTTLAWFNSSWKERKQLSITAVDALLSGHTFGYTLDMTDAKYNLANGDDLRLVLDTGTPVEVDRNITHPKSSTAFLEGKLLSATPTGISNTSYWIYWNNTAAGAAPNNKTKIYDIGEDFDGLSGETWNYYIDEGGRWSIYGGTLQLYFPTSNYQGVIAKSNKTFAPNHTVEITMKATSSAGSTACIMGFSSIWNDFAGNNDGLWGHDNAETRYINGGTASVGGTTANAGNENGLTSYGVYDVTLRYTNYKTMWNTTHAQIFFDGVLNQSTTTYIPTVSLPVAITWASWAGGSNGDKNVSVDSVTVKNYVPNGPIITLLTENTAPQWSLPSNITNGKNVSLNVTWFDAEDNVGFNFSILEVNFTGSVANYTNMTRIGNISHYNTTIPIGTYSWKVYANDSSNAWNVTSQFIFNIENTAPQWSSPVNDTNGTISLNVTWFDEEDNVGSNFTILEANFSGSLFNYTNMTRIGNVSHYNLTMPVGTATRYGWRVFANDSANMWNVTNAFIFDVIRRPPLWSNNQSLTPAIYNPTTASVFNITWVNGTSAVDTVLIEGNWSGSEKNYTMSKIVMNAKINTEVSFNTVSNDSTGLANDYMLAYDKNWNTYSTHIGNVAPYYYFNYSVLNLTNASIKYKYNVTNGPIQLNDYCRFANTTWKLFDIRSMYDTATGVNYTTNLPELCVKYPIEVKLWTYANSGANMSLYEASLIYNSTMVNYSYSDILPAGTWYWKSYANDSNGLWNVSSKWNFTINKAGTNLTALYLNGTQGNLTVANSAVNVTTLSTQSQPIIELWKNNTNLINGTSPLINISIFSTTEDEFDWNVTVSQPESQNYTAGSPITWWVNTKNSKPFWTKNISSTPVNYSPTTLSRFNVTWVPTYPVIGAIDTVLIEGNWSGNATNYTMSNITKYVYCYQETANVSVSCGGLNTGTYTTGLNSGTYVSDGNWVNESALYDGDWNTNSDKTNEDVNLFINYTKPINSTGAMWRTWTDSGGWNYSFPSACWNFYPDKISLQIVGESTNWTFSKCWAGSWQLVEGTQNPTYGEEGIYWEIAIENYYYSDVLPAGDWYWKSYAKTNNGFWNKTDDLGFKIYKSYANVNLSINGTTFGVWGAQFARYDAMNMTAWSNVSVVNISIVSNYTNWTILYGNPIFFESNLTQLGVWNATASMIEHQNYSGDSNLKYFEVLYSYVKELTLYINGSIVSREVESGKAVNITVDCSNYTGSAPAVTLTINKTNGIMTTSLNGILTFLWEVYGENYKLNNSDTINITGYTSRLNKTLMITGIRSYDEIVNASISLNGYSSGGGYPTNVRIFINNTLSNTIGGDVQTNGQDVIYSTLTTGESAKNITLNGTTSIVYVSFPKTAGLQYGYVNLSGFNASQPNIIWSDTYGNDTFMQFNKTFRGNLSWGQGYVAKVSTSASSSVFQIWDTFTDGVWFDYYTPTGSDRAHTKSVSGGGDVLEDTQGLKFRGGANDTQRAFVLIPDNPGYYTYPVRGIHDLEVNLSVDSYGSDNNFIASAVIIRDRGGAGYAFLGVDKNGAAYIWMQNTSIKSVWYNDVDGGTGWGWHTQAGSLTSCGTVTASGFNNVRMVEGGGSNNFQTVDWSAGWGTCPDPTPSVMRIELEEVAIGDWWDSSRVNVNLTSLKINVRNGTAGTLISPAINTSATLFQTNVTGFYGNDTFMQSNSTTKSICGIADTCGFQDYYVSADNGVHWEKILPNATNHQFVYPGTQLRYKVELRNSSVNSYASILEGLNISTGQYTLKQLTNVYLDVGANGVIDWNVTAVFNSTTSPQKTNNFTDAIDYYLSGCVEDISGYCDVPFVFGADTSGDIQMSTINISATGDYNIDLNSTLLRRLTTKAGNDIPIVFEAAQGILQVSNINVTYKGKAYFDINASCVGNTSYTRNTNLTVFWSNYSKKLPYTFTNDIVWPLVLNNTSNQTPWMQSNTVPIMNLTGYAWDRNFSVGININQTIPCLNLTASNTSNRFNGSLITTSAWTILGNMTNRSTGGIWLWLDTGSNCSAGYIGRTIRTESCCQGCEWNCY